MNTYGDRFRVTTYGESHGLAVGAVIDGCPAGVRIDIEFIDTMLARRRDGAPRRESDKVEWLSGMLNGITLGTPLTFLIRNTNTKSEDYAALEHMFRPGHADYTYQMKFGFRDHRGGGRASARETVARVVACAIAQQLMPEVQIVTTTEMPNEAATGNEDTYGGVVRCKVTGVPAGIGSPLFGKLNAQLAAAMFSIPSAIGFEMGAGFAAARMSGSEYIDRWNDETAKEDGETLTRTNHCGGIQGGISNGMPIEFSVAFHPVATLPIPVECLHEDGNLVEINVGGRHDHCHIQRAAVVVEAMTALCLINNL